MAKLLQVGQVLLNRRDLSLANGLDEVCGTGLRSPGALLKIATTTVRSTVKSKAAMADLPSSEVPMVTVASGGVTAGSATGEPVTWLGGTLFAAPVRPVAACDGSSLMITEMLIASVPEV